MMMAGVEQDIATNPQHQHAPRYALSNLMAVIAAENESHKLDTYIYIGVSK